METPATLRTVSRLCESRGRSAAAHGELQIGHGESRPAARGGDRKTTD